MTDWKPMALCDCGFATKATFGDLWFARQRYPVCPDCGAASAKWTLVTGRFVSQGWFKPERLEIAEPTED